MTDPAPGEAPGEVVREVGFDVNGNVVSPYDPRVASVEVTYIDRDTGEEVRTYLVRDAPLERQRK